MTLDSEDYDLAAPRADAMMQSLRSVGYDLPAAVADLVDNSITANARNVWIEFHWNGAASWVSLLDDGDGMDAGELVTAMRPGSRSPLEERSPRDLGRFGLGLKTASFSQCRSLTVGSRKKAARGKQALPATEVRRWDVDYVTRCGDWRLLRSGSATAREHGLPALEKLPSGTMVLWEAMDRLTPPGTDVGSSADQDVFYQRAEEVRAHLAMVFHRWLDGVPGRPFRLFMNGEPIRPWDPFCTRLPATQWLPEENIPFRGETIVVRPFIVPHHSKMTKAQHREAAGPRGWSAQQGFYVYRNKRLLVAGDWLGFFHREEHYKLARIQVDLPNSLDAAWDIDVKKSRAWPPASLRRQMQRIATAARTQASDVYRHRGARLVQKGAGEAVLLWEKKKRREKLYYSINREHPLVKALLAAPGATSHQVRALLSLVEETVPVPTITLDAAEHPDQHARPFEDAPPSAFRSALQTTYRALRASGYAREDAKVRLLNLEPFSQNREQAAGILSAFDE